ncbi:hypothetical protein BgiMline_026623, partial [Biomphalaria glabrata]
CTEMMSLLIYISLFGLASCQTIRLSFHLDSSQPDVDGSAKDLSVIPIISRTIYSIFCYGAVGDRFVLRMDPNTAHMEIVDRSIRFNNSTQGIDSCMPTFKPVQCTTTHFCSPSNNCVVNLAIDCGLVHGSDRWERTPQIEATLQNIHGELVLRDCFVMCLDSGYVEEVKDSGPQGLSYTAIGLIVSGIVIVAAMFVAGCVIWKLRVIRKINRQPHHHHMHFAK